ncbi:paraquat-inducible protein A [Paroceanicella profunda]|uniref:Paraquat-inducible protein A n=1 Tax=Paroceanicella profunda TaxID=2579971 RepID=A0A5B8G1K7_9RHOB|nr:paraquat-inducible protein A [Paroceanicella profunda]QDL92383.1 paraquat-inducible protein A [Paroceanicella profunda]
MAPSQPCADPGRPAPCSAALRLGNLALLVLYPLAWWAPLARAGFLPFFGGNEISILSGLATLAGTDLMMCAVVTLFAIVAPYAKTVALALYHAGRGGAGLLRAITLLGRLSMADIFLIALYVVMVKGVGIGHVEIAWGFYLFTALVLGSLGIAWASERGDTR